MKELAAIVVAEIQKTTNLTSLRGGIVLCGGGATLPYIDELFQKVTELETRVGIPNATASDEIKDPSYATSVGLVQVYFDQLENSEDTTPEVSTQSDYTSNGNSTKQKPPSIKSIFGRLVESLVGGDEEGGEY
jgi:cell division protein FtsA